MSFICLCFSNFSLSLKQQQIPIKKYFFFPKYLSILIFVNYECYVKIKFLMIKFLIRYEQTIIILIIILKLFNIYKYFFFFLINNTYKIKLNIESNKLN